MAKCKYPNEVCANMTVLNGNTYCDSVPCSLKDELPKQTNAERIRAMSDEELEEFLTGLNEHCLAGIGKIDCSSCDGYCEDNCRRMTRKWLQSEAE